MKATLGLCLVLVISTVGCCGVFTPTEENMTARMSPLVGHRAEEAVSTLRWSGFEILAAGPPGNVGNIIAKWTGDCLFIRDFVFVFVHVDERGKVTATDVHASRMAP
jgi:hypothetical protein